MFHSIMSISKNFIITDKNKILYIELPNEVAYPAFLAYPLRRAPSLVKASDYCMTKGHLPCDTQGLLHADNTRPDY